MPAWNSMHWKLEHYDDLKQAELQRERLKELIAEKEQDSDRRVEDRGQQASANVLARPIRRPQRHNAPADHRRVLQGRHRPAARRRRHSPPGFAAAARRRQCAGGRAARRRVTITSGSTPRRHSRAKPSPIRCWSFAPKAPSCLDSPAEPSRRPISTSVTNLSNHIGSSITVRPIPCWPMPSNRRSNKPRIRQEMLAAAAPRAYRDPELGSAGRFEYDSEPASSLGSRRKRRRIRWRRNFRTRIRQPSQAAAATPNSPLPSLQPKVTTAATRLAKRGGTGGRYAISQRTAHGVGAGGGGPDDSTTSDRRRRRTDGTWRRRGSRTPGGSNEPPPPGALPSPNGRRRFGRRRQRSSSETLPRLEVRRQRSSGDDMASRRLVRPTELRQTLRSDNRSGRS